MQWTPLAAAAAMRQHSDTRGAETQHCWSETDFCSTAAILSHCLTCTVCALPSSESRAVRLSGTSFGLLPDCPATTNCSPKQHCLPHPAPHGLLHPRSDGCHSHRHANLQEQHSTVKSCSPQQSMQTSQLATYRTCALIQAACPSTIRLHQECMLVNKQPLR